MNFKEIPAFILFVIGGLFAVITVIPIICDFLPILTFAGGQLTFLGTRLPNKVTITQINGWTFIGFAGYELVGAFAGIGAVSLLLALNTWKKPLPFETIKGISINGLVGLLMGLADVLLILLIYIGSTTNVDNFGFSNLANFSLTGYYFDTVLVGAQLGPGFILLLLSGPILIVGAIFSLMAKPSPTKPNSSNPSMA